tara:strand:- start:311 stop:481 length:171 start_codon:yes stop_codon:yes gene_type:complete
MNKLIFDIVDGEGNLYLSIVSNPTSVDADQYFDTHIRALLPDLAKSYRVEQLFWGV